MLTPDFNVINYCESPEGMLAWLYQVCMPHGVLRILAFCDTTELNIKKKRSKILWHSSKTPTCSGPQMVKEMME